MVTNYAPQEKLDQRLLLKEGSSPYQPNKERGKTVEGDSDHSLSSVPSIRTTRAPPGHNWKGAHDRGTPSPLFNDLMRRRHLGVRLSPFRERVSILCITLQRISHGTLRSCVMSKKDCSGHLITSLSVPISSKQKPKQVAFHKRSNFNQQSDSTHRHCHSPPAVGDDGRPE